MPRKIDVDATTGNKLLRLFRKLMLSHGRHYMTDLARELNCSPQTVGRLMNEIEQELGAQIESGIEGHKKWFRFSSSNSNTLGIDTEEIRYLSLCRDLADPYLNDTVRERLDKLILELSIKQLGETKFNQEYTKIYDPEYSFFSKGQIDYTPYVNIINKLERAARDENILKVVYRSSKSNKTKTILYVPKQFVCLSNALYVIGASLNEDFSFEKQKTLSVHRIDSVEKTEHKVDFVIPKADVSDFGLPWSKEPVTFTITFKPGNAVTYVQERQWCKNQKMNILSNGELELTIITKSVPEVISWCRGFGDRISGIKIDGNSVEDIAKNIDSESY